jgi:hypothetical protein
MFENAINALYPDEGSCESLIPSAYEMGAKDMTDLIGLVLEKGQYWEAISAAFKFGFVMGNRATHSRKLKRL